MKNLSITLLMMVMATTSFASKESYYSHGFEKELSGYDSEGLKEQLHNMAIKNHKVLGYKVARRYLFGDIHLEKDSDGIFVHDVYCNIDFREFDFAESKSIGDMKIPDNNKLNCEHTWPQSRFTSKYPDEMQKSDLHHLYPTESKANGKRGNNPFGNTSGDPLSSCGSSSIGRDVITDKGTYFEPPNEHKGNVARALFYFSVRYQLKLRPTEEMYLREWHELDPVDADEIRRNDRIEEVQGNRNPFIDYPSLVGSISDF